MLRLLTDENFNHKIVRGLRRRLPNLDCLVVQQAGLGGSADPLLLELAANEGRVMVSHDVTTMTDCAHERLSKGLEMPGLILVPNNLDFGRAVTDLEVLLGCSSENDLRDQVHYLCSNCPKKHRKHDA